MEKSFATLPVEAVTDRPFTVVYFVVEGTLSLAKDSIKRPQKSSMLTNFFKISIIFLH